MMVSLSGQPAAVKFGFLFDKNENSLETQSYGKTQNCSVIFHLGPANFKVTVGEMKRVAAKFVSRTLTELKRTSCFETTAFLSKVITGRNYQPFLKNIKNVLNSGSTGGANVLVIMVTIFKGIRLFCM